MHHDGHHKKGLGAGSYFSTNSSIHAMAFAVMPSMKPLKPDAVMADS
jgi:hypothetical protein